MNNTANNLQSETKDTLIMIKNGRFYNAYKDDAIILNYLFGYKVLKDQKAGFPETVLNKVINTLEDKKINYQIITKDYNPKIKKYDNLNNYKKVLEKALGFSKVQDRVVRLQEEINNITDLDLLERVIKAMEDELQRG